MTGVLQALDAALDARDESAARRLTREAVTAHGYDDVLDRLAASASAGSSASTELLIEQLDESGVVRRFVGGMLLDHAGVDDVCQDTLISVAQSVRSFAGGSKFTTWVHRIARNRMVDHLRRSRADVPLTDGDGAVGPTEHMSSMLATRATVRDTLAALPNIYREPVTLRDIEGLMYAEVAERLGRSVGTVKSQVARGRAMVAAQLEEPS